MRIHIVKKPRCSYGYSCVFCLVNAQNSVVNSCYFISSQSLSVNQKFINGNILFDTLYKYRIDLSARYVGIGAPGRHVGFNVEVDSDTTWYTRMDIIGRKTFSPGVFRKIDEIVTDEKVNRKLELVAEVTIHELVDSLTIIPVIWTVDEPFYKYMQTYAIHVESINDPLNVPTRMYSNIDGGVGIFGSYNRSMDTIRVKLPE